MSEPSAKPPADQSALIRKSSVAVILGMLASTLGPKLFAKVRDQRVMENGVETTAVVIDLDETGNYVNREPEIEVTVEIKPEGGEEFTAKAVKVMGPVELKRYDVGTTVTVRYDPDDRRHVVLVGPAAAASK